MNDLPKKRPVDSIYPEKWKLKQERKCPTCKKPITKFKDKTSKKEYLISGLCQECQDEIFGEMWE